MKKRFISLICLIFAMTLFLTGCGLFEVNQDRYLAKKVATVDDDIVVTMEDLLVGYNQYASTLINNYQYTNDEVIEYVIDMLINKKIMLREAKKVLGDLSAKETSKCWIDTYKTVNEILAEYETTIMAEWEISKADSPSEEEKARSVYEPFEKTAHIVQNGDGIWQIFANEEDELIDVEVIDGGADKFLATYRTISREDVSKEALKRYIKQLKLNEEGRKFEGNDPYGDNAVLCRAIDKIYSQIQENFYLSKLQKHLIANVSVSVDKVLEKYKELVLEDYMTYMNDVAGYETAILENADGMYYVPEQAQGKYFYVSHFLVKYSEEDQAIVDDLKTQLDEGYITQAEYDMGIELITSTMTATKFVDGNPTDEKISINALYTQLKNAMYGKSQEEKAEIFNNYIYWYNEDTTFNNKEFGYVVGDENSKMVESFNEASRALHHPNASDSSITGKVGDISGIVKSEYGVHFIMYCGEVENIFNINSSNVNDFTLSNADIKVLYDTLLYSCNNKTVFDKIYAEVYNDTYSIFESSYISSLKQDVDIKIYKKAYKKLLSK